MATRDSNLFSLGESKIIELCSTVVFPWREGTAPRECSLGGMSALEERSLCWRYEAPFEATGFGR